MLCSLGCHTENTQGQPLSKNDMDAKAKAKYGNNLPKQFRHAQTGNPYGPR